MDFLCYLYYTSDTHTVLMIVVHVVCYFLVTAESFRYLCLDSRPYFT